MRKIERTLVIIKPDAVVRGLIGEIISRFEKRGLRIVGMKMIHIDRELAERHYEEHKGKHFFEPLIDYITKAPSVVMVVEGRYAISVVRKMCGATDPKDAEPGSIRGDYGLDVGDAIYNVIHASDSPETAEREIALYFKEEELHEYCKAADWFYHSHWHRDEGEFLDSTRCLE
ncbi:nucleoside-diphosphate kinase [Palaeococcus sp. (in: euryarchaeotes)]|uniref:nucleoside-diphosphate kinase n=1 Tax=Palaeococcus sp. (in: euryarchaeotes) TaxID=2820298 RepID=UPI0025F1BF79|nr:nucleoside-diphosphate kinase [Palaeococcus sp. (in: euryarchaeotes)]MCD6559113.1 nucleoside-diphosphate kinase [Palaeococcus sp. (in: euryarchaeotes)]